MTPLAEIKTILDQIAATGTHAEADRAALLSALRVDGRGNIVIQMGKYNVNIERGQDIQIGDLATYQGSDAEAIRQIIRQILEEYRLRPGIPFQAPLLPEHFVPRPEVADALKAHLLADRSTTTPSILVVSAIHGLGGIGKSTLAAALACDSEVQQRFKDGILWATLGQKPDLLSLLNNWIQALGDYNFRPTAIEEASEYLKMLLHDKAVLLVLDNVWYENVRYKDEEYKSVAQIFRLGGPKCCLLLTTRDRQVADELGASIHPVPQMALDEAVNLLEKWARGRLDAVDHGLKTKIVKRLGGLPLAIKLAGAQLARPVLKPDQWLKTFKARILVKVEPSRGRRTKTDTTDPYDSLFKTFEMSLEWLPEADQRLYLALAIFKENEPIPQVGIARLWTAMEDKLDDMKIIDLLVALNEQALLQWTEDQPVILHDLLRDFITDKLGESGRIETHRLLLDSYRQSDIDLSPSISLPKGLTHWHTISDDGYLYDHLVYHLNQLADNDEDAFSELISLFATDAWLHKRIPQSGYRYDGYLADLMVVWNRIHHQAKAKGGSTFIINCVRYALIYSSLTSIASNYEVSLVLHAVDIGLWSTARAFQVAKLMKQPDKQAQLLTGLLQRDGLTEAQQMEAARLAMAASHEIEDKKEQAQALAALAPYLQGADQEEAVKHSLEKFSLPWPAKDTIETLVNLIPYIKAKEERERIAEIAIDTAYGQEKLYIFSRVVPYLREEKRGDVIRTCLEIALNWSALNEQDRVKALIAILRHDPLAHYSYLADQTWAFRMVLQIASRNEGLSILPYDLQQELWRACYETALAIGNSKFRAETLATLAGHLSSPEKENAVQAGLTVAFEIDDSDDRVSALIAFLPHLQGQDRETALEKSMEIIATDLTSHGQFRALMNIAPYLQGAWIQQGLEIGKSFDYEKYRAISLAVLIPRLSGKEREEALQISLAASLSMSVYWDDKDDIEALAVVLQHVQDEQKEKVLPLVLEIISKSSPDFEQVQALSFIAPYLQDEWLKKLLDSVLSLKSEWRRTNALAALVPHLDLETGLELALSLESQMERAGVLAAIALTLQGERKAEILGMSFDIALAAGSVEFLIALLPHLQPWQKTKVLNYFLAKLDERAPFEHPWIDDKVKLLIKILSPIQELDGQETLRRLLLSIFRANSRWLTQRLLTLCSQKGWLQLLGLNTISDLAGILVTLMPYLTEEEKRKVFQVILAYEDEQKRAQALITLAPHLGEALSEPDLRTALGTIEYKEWPVDILNAFAPYLKSEVLQPILQSALETATEIDDKDEYVQTLIALAAHIKGNDDEKDKVFRAGLTAFPVSAHMWPGDVVNFIKALAAMAPHLKEDLMQMAIEKAIAIGRDFYVDQRSEGDHYRAQALAVLSPYTEQDLMKTGLEVALEFEDEEHRVMALIDLVFCFPESKGEEAFQILWNLEDSEQRIGVLAILALRLRGKQRITTLLEVSNNLQKLDDEIFELSDFSPPYSFFSKLLIAYRDEGLLDEDFMQKVLNRVIAIDDDRIRAESLIALAHFLEGPFVKECFDRAQEISEKEYRAQLMAVLAPRFEGVEKQQKIEDCLSLVLTLEENFSRATILAELVPHLQGEEQMKIVQSGVGMALTVESKEGRVTALMPFLSYLEGEQKEEVLDRILKDVLKSEYELPRIRVLVYLIPYLPDREKEKALQTGVEIALTIDDSESIAEALELLAPYLHGELLQQAVNLIFEIWSPKYRAKTLDICSKQVKPPELFFQLLRESWLEHLHKTGQLEKRSKALKFLGDEKMLTAVAPPETVSVITETIIEITQHWRWL